MPYLIHTNDRHFFPCSLPWQLQTFPFPLSPRRYFSKTCGFFTHLANFCLGFKNRREKEISSVNCFHSQIPWMQGVGKIYVLRKKHTSWGTRPGTLEQLFVPSKMGLLFLVYCTVEEKLKWIALCQCKSNVKQQQQQGLTYSFPLISNPFEQNLHRASLSRSSSLLLLSSSLNDPRFSPDLQTHPLTLPSLHRKRRAGNFKSSGRSSPLGGRCTSRLWCGWPPQNWRRLLLLSSRFPRGHELSWQLAPDSRHLPEGLRPTVGTGSWGGSLNGQPALEVGHSVLDECFYFAERQPQARGPELESERLKVFRCEDSAGLGTKQKPIVKPGNISKFPQFLNGH